ncbi:MAG TPA: nucleotidyltransferase domain-containing protein [Kaistia sp.]|nr:nucleotidyltransferase domain-containing protein [Kaistia sp.]
MTEQQSDIRTAALAAAETILAERYPTARFGLAAGSIMRGEGVAGSDIDLVVIFEHLDAAWRESFVAHGFPVEAFVHDSETLDWFINGDVASGRPAIVQMIAEGIVLGGDRQGAGEAKRRAAALLALGPPPLDGERLDKLRYVITDLCDDIRAIRPATEVRAIAAALYQPIADLILLGRGRWTGSGKWAPRLIARMDQPLADAFDSAFHDIADGRPEALLALATSELARHGGPLFDGYRSAAPATARRPGATTS